LAGIFLAGKMYLSKGSLIGHCDAASGRGPIL
jgi:hypothetical protein